MTARSKFLKHNSNSKLSFRSSTRSARRSPPPFPPAQEYVKCIVSGGRVVGAMLVGEAVDLADTMEQIMMSRINVDALDFDLLDDNIEIDEYFD